MLRERGHFCASRPGRFVFGSSALGLGTAALLAVKGILMPAIQPSTLLAVFGLGTIYFSGVDFVKVRLFARLDLR
ncbi:MAG TPA: hypothetical protein VMK12_12910 [Anaeromyxobacteraceae bacterium]|nr:hypothetical protein [Anaeromyxobacteraceae bacterium]